MDDEITVAQRIRKFIRDLFGSRLVEHLESQMFQQQSQYESRLNERDQEIARLRDEVTRLQGKFDELELDPSYFWFLSQRGKSAPAPKSDSYSLSEPTSLTWAQIQQEHDRQQQEEASKETSNGISDSGRDEVVRV